MNYAHTYTCSRPARRSTFVAGRCEHVVLTTTRSIPYIYIYIHADKSSPTYTLYRQCIAVRSILSARLLTLRYCHA